MEQPPGYPMLFAMAAAAAASITVCFRLFVKHIDGRPLLEYAPRRPVPWGLLTALILFLPLAAALLGSSTVDAADPPADPVPEAVDVNSVAAGILGSSLMMCLIAWAAYLLLYNAVGVAWRDLGLPASWSEFRRDVGIGLTACLAALVPVYFLLNVLQMFFESNNQHPLIKQLQQHHSIGMLAASGFAAVIAAPIYEETAFRLLFQGWLERPGTRLRNSPALPPTVSEPPADGVEPPAVDPPVAVEAPVDADFVDTPPPLASAPEIVAAPNAPIDWPPIIISGFLFGLAHWGHNVSTTPLILLGFVLGYVYQRTHRIVPCIVCHMAFNAFSLLMLALMLYGS